MKFAELSSSFNDEQDAKNEFKLKYEEANQNLLLKEDLIQKLLKQIEKEYTSNNNRNNKNHINNFVNNNNTNSSPLQTEPNFNSKNYKTKTEKNSNVFTSRLENNQFAFDNKNMKKEFYGLDDLDYNDDNYLTTIGINSNLTRKTEENYYNENDGGYSKTEHMENIKNYKELKKKEKTKSSIFGSIKGFFNK